MPKNDKQAKNRFMKFAEAKIGHKIFCNNQKTPWQTFNNKTNDIKELAKNTIKGVKQAVREYNEYNPSTTEYEESKRKEVTFSKSRGYYSPYRAEEALERIIIILNNKDERRFINQIIVADNGHIDFSIVDNKGCAAFVELKMWTNDSDSPMYAVLESLKNYFEYKAVMNNEILEKNIKEGKNFDEVKKQYKEHNIEQVKELIILAPMEYYRNFTKSIKDYECYKKAKWEAFFEYVSELNDLLKNEIKISVKYINVPYGDTKNNKNLKKGDWLYIMKNNFNPIIKAKGRKISLETYKNEFKSIEKELLADSWLKQDLKISDLF